MIGSKGQSRVIANPEIVSEPTNRSHKGMVIRGWIPALVGAERHSLDVFIPTFSLKSWFAKLGSRRLSLKPPRFTRSSLDGLGAHFRASRSEEFSWRVPLDPTHQPQTAEVMTSQS